MTVSIIIRTYNRAHSIAQAISSALAQSFSDFEIVVVDDGSTDATNAVIRSFRDKRIRVLRHETNRGVGAACNTGIAGASGELIAWLDSDDTWHPEKLEQQVRFLKQHSEIDAVFSDLRISHGSGEIPSLARYLKVFPRLLMGKPEGGEFVISQREMYLCLLEEVPIKPTVLVVRRNVFERVGLFDEATRSGEDWEFLLRLARMASFGYVDRPLAIMNWTLDSTYRLFWVNDKSYLVSVLQRERKRLEHDEQAIDAVQRGISKHFKSLGYRYVEMGKPGKAAMTYLQGFKVTRNAEMILQAGAALIPVGLRRAVMRRVRAATSVGG